MTAPVDPRFAELINTILSREWLVLIRPTQSLLAELLGVSRTTVWAWQSSKTNISFDMGERFDNRIGLLGFFADGVLEIHRDIAEQRLADFEHKKIPRVDVPVVHINYGHLSNRRRFGHTQNRDDADSYVNKGQRHWR